MKNKNYSVINMETWPRKLHCAIFRESLMPQYCVSFDLNITHFYREIKRRGLSFSMAFMYETAKCGNKIENFRYRFENGEVVLYDQIGTSFTYMEKGAELFKMIKVDMKDTLEEYIETAQTIIKNQTAYFDAPPGNDVFVFSAIPWISFHYISHTYGGNRESASPAFDWGKFFERDGEMWLPFSVQVHHSFIDGVHIGRFADMLQKQLDEF